MAFSDQLKLTPNASLLIERPARLFAQVRSTAGFGLGFIGALCSLQKELDFHGLKRKDNLTVLCAVKHACV